MPTGKAADVVALFGEGGHNAQAMGVGESAQHLQEFVSGDVGYLHLLPLSLGFNLNSDSGAHFAL